MLPNFPEFSKLSLDHQKDIDEAISGFPPYSDYTFASLYPWDTQNKLELSSLNGNLIVKFTDYVTDEPFLSFLGTNEVEETATSLIDFARSPQSVSWQTLKPFLKLIPEATITPYNRVRPESGLTLLGSDPQSKYVVEEDPDNFDYVYLIDELAGLRGEKYRQKRNEINNFKKKYVCEVKMLDPKDSQTWPRMESVLNLWAARQLKKGNNAKNDVAAVKRTLQIAGSIKLLIFGFFVDGTLRGYTLVELNQGGYATDLFEHADTSFDGIFPFQRHTVATSLSEMGYKFLNNQQDLGIAGLKFSKEQWNPAFYLKKYTIYQNRAHN